MEAREPHHQARPDTKEGKRKKRKKARKEGGCQHARHIPDGAGPSNPLEQRDSQEHASDDADDETQYLAAAAANWAESVLDSGVDWKLDDLRKEEPRTKANKARQDPKMKIISDGNDAGNSSSVTKQKWSLHVTQLPYDATEFAIRQHFATVAGCTDIVSLRMVYDPYQQKDALSTALGPNSKSRNVKKQFAKGKGFRGVAFVDVLADQATHEEYIQLLHHNVMDGRTINVRPTRTREELATIVAKTQRKVKEQIKLNSGSAKPAISQETLPPGRKISQKQSSNETPKKSLKKRKRSGGKSEGGSEPQGEKTASRAGDNGKKGRAEQKESGEKESKNKAADAAGKGLKAKGSPSSPGKLAPRPGEAEKNDRKLTKKERNRKAAILLQMKRQRRS
jgi:hypothetical protein